jgi:L-fuconolactonase
VGTGVESTAGDPQPSPETSDEFDVPMAVVDAHLHLWDLRRSAYEWITPELGPLHTTFTAERAHAELRGAGVGRAVLVQAEDSEADTEFMLEVATANSWVAGVVGWLKLDDPAAAERQLDRWSAEPTFVGVRHLVHDDPRDDFLALPAVRTSLRLLAARGLPFDVPDAWPRHLAATAELAAALPGLTVVLDHLGKPPHGQPEFAEWRSVLADVAAHPNTVAKVSGLQVRGMPFTADVLRPAWDAALELFGPHRLIWGSDWPMTLLAAGYAGTWDVLSALVGELTADEQQKVLAGTACRVYRLGSVLTKQLTTPEAPC